MNGELVETRSMVLLAWQVSTSCLNSYGKDGILPVNHTIHGNVSSLDLAVGTCSSVDHDIEMRRDMTLNT